MKNKQTDKADFITCSDETVISTNIPNIDMHRKCFDVRHISESFMNNGNSWNSMVNITR